MKKELVAYMTVGVPGCGKSTVASANAIAIQDMVRIERDIFRESISVDGTLSGFYGMCYTKKMRELLENNVTYLHERAIRDSYNKGKNIIISDTNITFSTRHRLYRLLWDIGYRVELIILGEDLSIDELIDCNENRPETDKVPVDVIKRMYTNFHKQLDQLKTEWRLLMYDVQSLEYDKPKDDVIIIDVDDTVAEAVGRSPYEEDKVHLDKPIWRNIDLIKGVVLQNPDARIMFFSGRSDYAYYLTVNWLMMYFQIEGIPDLKFELYMRKHGDYRKDWIVKGEMYEKHVHNKLNVLYVFDDRQQVVNYWNNVNLPVIQVNQSKY